MTDQMAADEHAVARPSGFVSYVHQDNDKSGGKLLRLVDQIEDEFSLITGEDLALFIDRRSIEWGEEWRQRIESALQDTTFFIPIVTPKFFQSTECRSELMKFAGFARSMGAEELLLPIIFVGVDDLNEDSPDEAKALIARTHYVNWSQLRLVDDKSAEYQQAVNDLATRLATVSAAYAEKAAVTPAGPGPGAEDADVDWDDTEPGFIDHMVQVQEVMPRWQANLEAFPEPMTEIGVIAREAGTKMQEGDAQGKTFGYRVLVARETAEKMDAPASQLQRTGEEYASNLLAIDPGTRAAISLANMPQFQESETDPAREMFRSLLKMIATSRRVGATIEELIGNLAMPAKQYKDLRPPLKKMRAGLRSFLDGQAVYDEWERLIHDSPVYSPDLEPEENDLDSGLGESSDSAG